MGDCFIEGFVEILFKVIGFNLGKIGVGNNGICCNNGMIIVLIFESGKYFK